MSRSDGAFSAQLVSSRYTGTRPTCAFHSRATTSRPRDAHADLEPLALRIACRLDRQIARVALAVLGVLHAVVVDRLREVALLVQQAHRRRSWRARRSRPCSSRRPARRGRPSRSGSSRGSRTRRRSTPPAARPRSAAVTLQIGIEVSRAPGGSARGMPESRAHALEPLLVHAAQHQARVAAGLLPQLRIEVLEQRPGRAVPAEEQVAGQLRQAGQAPRDYRGDFQERISHQGLSGKEREV